MPGVIDIGERRGLTLPATVTRGGYFASRTDYDVVWSKLLVALFTPIGSRPMRRTYGSGIYSVVFDPVQDQDPIIEYLIRSAAALWVPEIVIYTVRTVAEGRKVSVHVTYGLRDHTDRVSRAIDIDRAEAIRTLSAVG